MKQSKGVTIAFLIIMTILVIVFGLMSCTKEPARHKFTCVSTVITQRLGYCNDTTLVNVNPTELMTNEEIQSFISISSNQQYITVNNIPVIAVEYKMQCKLADCFNY